MQSKGNLFIVAAPSGAGKTSLTHEVIQRLAQQDIAAAFSTSYTTRDPRPGEVDGQDYHFITPDTFARMVSTDAFLEYATVFDRSYGTGKAATQEKLDMGHDVILDIDWQGAQQIRKLFPNCISIFILPPSEAELEKRLIGRGQDSAETIAKRMQQAQAEMSHYNEFEYVLVNDDFEQAAQTLQAIFLSARARQHNFDASTFAFLSQTK